MRISSVHGKKTVFCHSGPLMKLTHIVSSLFLTHIVSEAAKTFGKSHRVSEMQRDTVPSRQPATSLGRLQQLIWIASALGCSVPQVLCFCRRIGDAGKSHPVHFTLDGSVPSTA